MIFKENLKSINQPKTYIKKRKKTKFGVNFKSICFSKFFCKQGRLSKREIRPSGISVLPLLPLVVKIYRENVLFWEQCSTDNPILLPTGFYTAQNN